MISARRTSRGNSFTGSANNETMDILAPPRKPSAKNSSQLEPISPTIPKKYMK